MILFSFLCGRLVRCVSRIFLFTTQIQHRPNGQYWDGAVEDGMTRSLNLDGPARMELVYPRSQNRDVQERFQWNIQWELSYLNPNRTGNYMARTFVSSGSSRSDPCPFANCDAYNDYSSSSLPKSTI